MPAMSASRSDSSPSVAEMSVRSSCSNEYGRAPVWRTSARSSASPLPSRPLICARPPAMPLAVSPTKSIVGNERISLSRTIAKLWSAIARPSSDPVSHWSWAQT